MALQMGSDSIEAGNDLTDGQTPVAADKNNYGLHCNVLEQVDGLVQ